MIRKFSFELDSWLRAALEDLPESLRAVKIDRNVVPLLFFLPVCIAHRFFVVSVARHFCHMLRRQSSLNGLFGTVRLALHDQQLTGVLLHDWQRQDLQALAKGALQTSANLSAEQSGTMKRRMSPNQINSATVDFLTSRQLFLNKKLIFLKLIPFIIQSDANLSVCWRSRRRWRPTRNGSSRSWIGASCSSAAATAAAEIRLAQ